MTEHFPGIDEGDVIVNWLIQTLKRIEEGNHAEALVLLRAGIAESDLTGIPVEVLEETFRHTRKARELLEASSANAEEAEKVLREAFALYDPPSP